MPCIVVVVGGGIVIVVSAVVVAYIEQATLLPTFPIYYNINELLHIYFCRMCDVRFMGCVNCVRTESGKRVRTTESRWNEKETNNSE